MGIVSAIKGIVGLGSSGEKIVDTGADLAKDVSSGIDKMFYTKEEKADDAASHRDAMLKAKEKGFEFWLKVQEAIKNENSIRSMTRRKLADSITNVFLFFLISSGVLWKYDKLWAGHFFELAKALLPYFGGIVGFFFLYYGTENIISKVKK